MEPKYPTDEDLKNFLLKKYLEEQFQNEINESNQKDIKKYEERLQEVTPEIFFRFLSEKGVSGACVSCGSPKLSVPESRVIRAEKIAKEFKKLSQEEQNKVDEGLAQRYVTYVAFGDTLSPSGINKIYYVVHCLNCGYLSLYRASAVLKWLEKDKEQDDCHG
ncbi:hypothetical protein [Escherichia coli]|uniref:hypothetical protein n=1 Tax=Escherichia coli TaxID=562 RepID=UPI00164145BF